jgi:hypothetical protein
VTQCSPDRFLHLEKQIQNWSGVVSAAIWIPISEDKELIKAKVKEIFDNAEKKGTCKLDIALVYDNEVLI